MAVVVGTIGVAIVVVWMLTGGATGNVVLYGNNVSLSFDDMEASFGPAVKATGECGKLHLANPPGACSHLTNKVDDDPNSVFVLIIRGGCNFEEKVRNAQRAGFNAAIIYDDEYSESLIPMSGNYGGIHIPAVFVARASGDVLKQYVGCPDVDVWILPIPDDGSSWSLAAISFLALIASSALLGTCCFVRSHHVRRQQPRVSQILESHGGMSDQLVKALPTLVFTEALDDCCTSTTCAICLDDYKSGDKLRILPCKHKFHAVCVDCWLTSWRTFCPMCKQDVRNGISRPSPSERTPLLSPLYVSPTPAAASPSFRSSAASSPAMAITSPSRSLLDSRMRSSSPFQHPIMSRNHSISSTPHTLNHLRSYNNSPASRSLSNSRMMAPSPSGFPIMSPNHSISSTPHTMNQLPSYNNSPAGSMWNLSSQGSHVSYLTSSNSLGQHLPSSFNSRFASPYARCSGTGSSNYLGGSSSRPSYLRHNESVTSLSAFASSHSLAEN